MSDLDFLVIDANIFFREPFWEHQDADLAEEANRKSGEYSDWHNGVVGAPGHKALTAVRKSAQ